MSYLVSHYLPWIAVSLLLGLAVGWVTAERRRPHAPSSSLLVGLFVAALAIWLAVTHLLPGRVGHGFEVLLLLLVGYVFGGLIGEPLRLALAPPLSQRNASAEDASPRPMETPDGGLAAVAAAAVAAMQAPDARTRTGASEPAAGGYADLALTSIAGIGPHAASQLTALRITKVADVASWGAEDAAFIGERIGAPGRVEREMWIAQARLLAAGIDTSHSIAQRMGRVQARDADAPLDDVRIASVRHELEDLSETAGVNAFSFGAPRTAHAMRVDAASNEIVSDDHKPALLAAAPAEGADNLKLIWGVGPKLESMLNEMGVYRFAQMAEWSEMNLRWVDQNLDTFRGRAARDRWVNQAQKLADGWRPNSYVGEKFND